VSSDDKGILSQFTPLHAAIFFGHAKIVDELIAAGANIEDKAGGKITALELALTMGHADIADKLKSKMALLDSGFPEANDSRPQSNAPPYFITIDKLKEIIGHYRSTSIWSGLFFTRKSTTMINLRALTKTGDEQISLEKIAEAIRADGERRLKLFENSDAQQGKTSTDDVIVRLRDFFHPITPSMF
jgi:hypothetical protein